MRSFLVTEFKMPRYKWVSNLSPNYQTCLLCITLSLGYCTTYLFTRPLFVLPDDYLNVSVAEGSKIDRQTAMALAQSLGYLSSKFVAIPFMSSALFFKHRQFTLSCLFTSTASIIGVGFAIFNKSPIFQSVAVGFGSIFAGIIYGGMLSYAEGRGSTEIIIAALNLMLVIAGGIARFLGSTLVSIGTPSHFVPGVASSVGLCVGLILLDLLASLPPATKVDQQERGIRRSMTSEERILFLKKYGIGIFLSLIAYSTIMTLRSFRDYFAVQLYTEANGNVAPSPSIYFWADFPGAVTVCFSLGALSYCKDNRKTLILMITMMILGVSILGGGTLLYSSNSWNGIAWQVSCGAGIYTAYLVMGSAFFDRLLAASNSEGTIIFLQFISDGTGWLGTVGILFWKSLIANPTMPVSELYSKMCLWSSLALIVSLVLMLLYFLKMLPPSPPLRDESFLLINDDRNVDISSITETNDQENVDCDTNLLLP